MILLVLLGVLLTAAFLAVRHARKPPVRIVGESVRGRVRVVIERRAFHRWPQQLAQTSTPWSTDELYVGSAAIGDDDKLARLIVHAHALIDTATGDYTRATEMERLAQILAGRRS